MADKFVNITSDIDKLGINIPDDPTAGFTDGEKYVYKWAVDTIDIWRKELNTLDKNSTGNLSSSFIPLPIERFGGGFTLKIEAADYWKFIDLGVKGAKSSTKAPNSPFKYTSKYPPLDAVTKWLNFKPEARLKLANIYGLDDSPESRLAIAKNMQKSIYKRGIKATPFVRSAINKKRIDDLQENILKYFSKKIDELMIVEKK